MKTITNVVVTVVDFAVFAALVAIAVTAALYAMHVSQESALVQSKSDAVVTCFKHAETTAEVEACSALRQGMGF